jgi:uncharacterized protein (DUF927 family)
VDRWRSGHGREQRLHEITTHLESGGNVGLAIPPGVVVLDADTPEAVAFLNAALPDAPMQESRPGRAHFAVRVPLDASINATVNVEIAPGVKVDVRSAGLSQIVVEPSIHPTGSPYTWKRPLLGTPDVLPQCPPAIFEAITEKVSTSGTRGEGTRGSIGEGRRNDYLYRYGCGMRARGLSRDEIACELHEENNQRCAPPLGSAEVETIVESAMRYAAGGTAEPGLESAVRFPFRVMREAVEYADDNSGEPEWKFLCSRLEVIALTRSDAGEDWGALLRWKDADCRIHEWAMPWELLARADGSDWLGELLRLGLVITPGRNARQRLHEYLTTTRPAARVRCVSRIGWHDRTFVLPDVVFGASAEAVRLQTTAPLHHAFRESGTPEDWQREVGALCVGNSRLVFAVSVAFGAPILELIGAESGGFHILGGSTIGKTTALRASGSVWGGGGLRGYLDTWRATANGLEGTAAAHCDVLLCLDEISLVDAREAGAVAYMLANGTGKHRARRDGSARPAAAWRLLFLSSGEIGLADKVREDGKRRATAGQAVRVVDVPADAGVGLGLFENLHGSPDAHAFAERVGANATTFYGTAGRAFAAALAERPDEIAELIRDYRGRFLAAHVPKDASGQVQRAAGRFAIAAAAGELAMALGVVPWPEGEAVAAAKTCFQAWLAERGGTGPAELADALERVRGFFLEHGSSRFDSASGDEERPPVRDRAGWWRGSEDGGREWLVSPNVFRDELAAGFDSRALARECIVRGWLRPGNAGRSSRSERVSGMGKIRVYVFTDAVVSDADDS